MLVVPVGEKKLPGFLCFEAILPTDETRWCFKREGGDSGCLGKNRADAGLKAVEVLEAESC